MLSTGLEYFLVLECFLEGWNAFDRVGMLSTGLECFRQGWNAFDRVGMLSRGLEWFRQGWNAFDRVGIPLYRVRML
jgi:hypothetical protein